MDLAALGAVVSVEAAPEGGGEHNGFPTGDSMICDTNALRNELEDNLVSAIRYEEDKLLIVVEKGGLGILNVIMSHCDTVPLVLRRQDINDGIDVFPVDLLHILASREVIEGDDVFEGIKLAKPNLRSQVEFELRSRLIGLRQRYMTDAKRGPEQIIQNTIDTLKPVLQGMYALRAQRLKDVPSSTADLLKGIEKEFGWDLTILHKIYKAKKFPKTEAKKAVNELVTLLTTMCDDIDKIK